MSYFRYTKLVPGKPDFVAIWPQKVHEFDDRQPTMLGQNETQELRKVLILLFGVRHAPRTGKTEDIGSLERGTYICRTCHGERRLACGHVHCIVTVNTLSEVIKL